MNPLPSIGVVVLVAVESISIRRVCVDGKIVEAELLVVVIESGGFVRFSAFLSLRLVLLLLLLLLRQTSCLLLLLAKSAPERLEDLCVGRRHSLELWSRLVISNLDQVGLLKVTQKLKMRKLQQFKCSLLAEFFLVSHLD